MRLPDDRVARPRRVDGSYGEAGRTWHFRVPALGILGGDATLENVRQHAEQGASAAVQE
jgi:hypothetical protein